MSLLVKVHGKAIVANTILESIYLFIDNEKIQDISPLADCPPGLETVEIPQDQTIVPGFIDVHIHGIAGADVMDATPEALTTMAKALPAEGTTSFLATTMTQHQDQISRALQNAAEFMKDQPDSGQAEVLGIHLEGPFIHPNKKGAQPEAFILKPDTALFSKWQELAKGGIKLVTCAPEMENGLEFISYLHKNGVIASIGHSDAVYDDVKKAVAAGARHVTHLFNGMSGIHHREPGAAGSALLFQELMVELIADGIHVRPELFKLVHGAKGANRIILITDALRAKCLKDGVYDLGGQEASVKDGIATLADGTLAGSTLKMKDAFKNMIEFAALPILDVVQMTSVNPAQQLNIFDRKGSIEIGKDADLTILSSDYDVVLTICRGKIAYNGPKPADGSSGLVY